MRKIKPDIIVAISEPSWPCALVKMVLPKTKFVFFPYDVTRFRYKEIKDLNLYNKIEIALEKWCLEKANIIIHKGPKHELSYLNYNIRGKDFQFLPSCFEPFIIPLVSENKRLAGMHITYTGTATSFDPGFSIGKMYESIAKQGIDFHLYPTSADEDALNVKNKFYHIHNKLPPEKLAKEISKYQFGVKLCFEKGGNLGPFFQEVTMSNKIFSYLEAGLPLIVDDKNTFVADIVKEHEIGLVITEEETQNLKLIIKKCDYKELLRNVENARLKLNIKPQCEELMDEINKLLN